MAGLIRSDCRSTTASFSFADLEQQGLRIVAAARAEAVRILQEAEKRGRELAETRQREGFEKGLAEGRRAGAEQIRAESKKAVLDEERIRFAELAKAMRAGLDGFDASKRHLIAMAETDLIRLALQIARRVCKLDVGKSSEAALENARHLLGLVRGTHDIEIRFHPEDHSALAQAADVLAADARIIADESVSRGGCVLRGASGTVDAGIDVQLDRIAQTLVGARDGE